MNGPIPVNVQTLISEYTELFMKPSELPPSRTEFDHQILLMVRVEPINKKLYRYPAFKKTIIVKLVIEMCERGWCNPVVVLMVHLWC